MTAVDLALACALSAMGGALLVLAGVHDWRLRALSRRLWGDPDLGRRPFWSPRRDGVPPEPRTDPALQERLRLAELRAAEAREAVARLRREAGLASRID